MRINDQVKTLNNVWVINDNTSESNLISVSALTRQLNTCILFDRDGAYIVRRTDDNTFNKTSKIATLKNGLYIIDKDIISNDFRNLDKNAQTIKHQMRANYTYITNSYHPSSFELLVHNRLGHLCKSYMLQMTRVGTLNGINQLDNSKIKLLIGKGSANPCIGCIAKMNREPKSRRTRGPQRPKKDKKIERLEPSRTVSTDTFGPFFPNYYGIKYAQIFVHIQTRKAWLFGMTKKSEFPVALEEFLLTYKRTYPDKPTPEICRSKHVATFRTNTNYEISIVRTDRAPEYSTQQADKLYREFNIQHIQTVAHSSWENGFAERAIQTFNKIASAQLIAAKFTPEEYQHLYWQSLRHACTVYNFCPHKGLKYQCPEEAWTGVKPHIDQLRTFGATAFEYLNATQRSNGKRARRFRIGIYIGNTPGVDIERPAMRIYIPHMNQIYIRRSVILDESLSHTEKRLQHLRNGGHYVEMENENTKVLIPTLPPSFAGGDDEWAKQGSTLVYNNGETSAIDEKPSIKPKIQRRMHLRSDGPIQKTVTLIAFKKNAKISEKMKLINVHHNTAEIHVDYNWIAKASQHKDYKVTLKQFDNPSLAEAMLREDWPLWQNAIQKEFNQLKARGTWEHVDGNTVNKRPLGTKLVLKIKRDARTNEIEKYKARLTVQGFRQVQGHDYTKTTSPVTVYATFLFLIAHAIRHGRKLKTMDFAGAFLYAHLHEEIYIKPPELYKAKNDVLLRLRKSLYGLKQASREWHLAVTRALLDIGFRQAQVELDQCLFIHDELDIFLCIHVDDCFMSYNDKESINVVVKALEKKNFEFSAVEELKKGLGLSIKQDEDEIVISQPQYVNFILNEFKEHLTSVKKVQTPLSKLYKDKTDEEESYDETRYRSLLGCLGHLGRMTRPDIIQAVFHLAQFSSNPSKEHWKGLCRIVSYLSSSKDSGIRFSKESDKLWEFYVDADWGGCPTTRRSTTGYLIKYCSGPLIAVSKRQRNVTLSSTEAEYCAFTDIARDIIWTKRLAKFFKEEFPEPAVIWNDNLTAQNIAHGEMTLNRMKHVDALSKHSGIRYHWIRELILAGLIELKHVSSSDNESDLFTKPLGRQVHERLKTKVMNTNKNQMKSNFVLNYEYTTTINDEIDKLIYRIGA